MCLEEYDAEFHEKSLRQEGIIEGRQEGILGAIHLLKSVGLDEDTIIHKISQEFNLTVEEASSYVHSDNR